MRTLLPVVAVLLSVSCAGSPVSQDVRRIVPLIKAEKFDEAAAISPDLMAPACVEALRQLESEGVDPKRIVSIADRFFDLYPFCARDLEIDERVVQAVADTRFRASAKLTPGLDSCADMRRARTFVAKLKVLEGWQESEHRDGGRCAHDVREFLDHVLKRGRDWFFDSELTGRPGPVSSSWAAELWESCWRPFDDDPQILLLAFRVSRIHAIHGHGRHDSWCDHDELLEDNRWSRFYRIRRGWLGAFRFQPALDVADFGEVLEASKSPRLRELAACLKSWKEAEASFRSQAKPDLATCRPVLHDVDRLASGTPFPDWVRYSLVAPLLEGKSREEAACLEEAERLVRILRPEFTHPFLPSLAMLLLADWHLGDDLLTDSFTNLERADRLAREVLAWDPKGPTAAMAHYIIGWVHGEFGRPSEKISSMQAAVSVPKDKGPYEHTTDAAARSRAGFILALHHEGLREWLRALEAWRSWESYGTCGLHHAENDEARSLGIARSLDALGRISEAASHYWEGVAHAGCDDLQAAKRLIEIHRKSGSEAALTLEVRRRTEWLVKREYKIGAALKLLADELGIPLK